MSASLLLELWRKIKVRQEIAETLFDFSQDEGLLEVASKDKLRVALVDFETSVRDLRAAL